MKSLSAVVSSGIASFNVVRRGNARKRVSDRKTELLEVAEILTYRNPVRVIS